LEESKVFMVNTKGMIFGDSLIDRLTQLWNHLDVDLKEWIEEKDIVVIKTHFGHLNQTRHIRPIYIRKIVDLIRKAGGIPWVAEGTGLELSVLNPEGSMTTAPAYQQLAARHGFSLGTVNAPIVILDGVWGTDTRLVDNHKGKHLKKTAVAMGLIAANKILVVSHFKGHDLGGFGGALKQLAMGCVGKEGKGDAHFGKGNFVVKNPNNCNSCGKCIKVCPTQCLSLKNGKIKQDIEKCIVCLHCSAVCNIDKPNSEKRVFGLKKRLGAIEQVERMMDNAVGVVNAIGKDNFRYLNLAIDITSSCDCADYGGHQLVPDQGILYSKDPVAIDQASVDLVTKARGSAESPAETGIDYAEAEITIDPKPSALKSDSIKLGPFSVFAEPEVRDNIANIQLKNAEDRGLGIRSYKLIDIIEKED
jgi:uncharacterized Fe-S center protein